MLKFLCCPMECQRCVVEGLISFLFSLLFFWNLVNRGSLAEFVGMWVCFLYLDKSHSCRIVEYSTRDEAQNAIQTLSNTSFMNRQIFIREVIHLFNETDILGSRTRAEIWWRRRSPWWI